MNIHDCYTFVTYTAVFITFLLLTAADDDDDSQQSESSELRTCHGIPCEDYRRIQKKTLHLFYLYRQNQKSNDTGDFWDSVQGTALENPQLMSDAEWEWASLQGESVVTEAQIDAQIQEQNDIAAGYNSTGIDIGETASDREKKDLQKLGKWLDTSQPVYWAIKDDPFDAQEMNNIHSAMSEFVERTCLPYQQVPFPKPGEKKLAFKFLRTRPGCWATQAYYFTKTINLAKGCAAVWTILHEVMHTLGASHEHNRMDRDQYLKFYPENTDAGGKREFSDKNKVKQSRYGMDFVTPYDFSSNLNYYTTVYSINGKVTHAPLDEIYTMSLNYFQGHLTFYDVKAINLSPLCKHFCENSPKITCHHGGYPHPRHCDKCVCPDGFSSSSQCTEVDTLKDAGGCGHTINLGSDSVYRKISTPTTHIKYSYPSRQAYSNKLKCNWHVKASPGNRIQLKFDSKPSRLGIQCGQAYLQIQHKGDLSSGPRVCGQTGTVTNIGQYRYVSDGDEMMLTFHHHKPDTPDYKRRGFTAYVRAVKFDDLPTEEQSTHILPQGYQEKIFTSNSGTPATNKPTKSTTNRPTTRKSTTSRPTTRKSTTSRPTTTKATTRKPYTTKATTKRPYTTKSTYRTTMAKTTTRKPITSRATTRKPYTTKTTTRKTHTTKTTTRKPVTTRRPHTTKVTTRKPHTKPPSTTSRTTTRKPYNPHQGSSNKGTPSKPSPDKAPPFKFTCDFENNDLCGIEQKFDDRTNWQFISGRTPTDNTGPRHAYSGSSYLYYESSYPRKQGDTAGLLFPAVPAAGQYCLRFWVCMYGEHVGTLTVSDTHGKVFWKEQGDRGSDWVLAEAVGRLAAGGRFEMMAIRGEDFRGDIAIDTVTLTNC